MWGWSPQSPQSSGDIVPYDASRPSTALAIEERLRRSDAAREAPESEPPPRAEVLLVDPARDEIRAAREGRKGLFIAALKQQAKYWQAEAFNAWCRVFLQERNATKTSVDIFVDELEIERCGNLW